MTFWIFHWGQSWVGVATRLACTVSSSFTRLCWLTHSGVFRVGSLFIVFVVRVRGGISCVAGGCIRVIGWFGGIGCIWLIVVGRHVAGRCSVNIVSQGGIGGYCWGVIEVIVIVVVIVVGGGHPQLLWIVLVIPGIVVVMFYVLLLELN